jgi:hypothetical protein
VAGFIMHKDALVACDHAPGIADADSPDLRVKVSGMPVMTVLRTYTVTACALQSTNSPPCTTGMWTKGAQHVLVGGFPVAIDSGQSLCLTSFGKLNPRVVQQRVQAS